MKMFRENPKLFKVGHKSALYMKIKFFIVSGNINSD